MATGSTPETDDDNSNSNNTNSSSTQTAAVPINKTTNTNTNINNNNINNNSIKLTPPKEVEKRSTSTSTTSTASTATMTDHGEEVASGSEAGSSVGEGSSPAGSQGVNGSVTGVRRGKCKWFNVAKGWGFITPNDGGQDVFVHQSVIHMMGFRSLGDDEEIEFECKVSDKGLEATMVRGCDGNTCKGSHRRPISKKKFRRLRCYNCGEFANHIASKCTVGPQPKKCHNCKAEDHLIADCPNRKPGSRPKSAASSNAEHQQAGGGNSKGSSPPSPDSTSAANNNGKGAENAGEGGAEAAAAVTSEATKQNEKAA